MSSTLRVRHVPLWIVLVSHSSVAIVTIVSGIRRARRVSVVLSSECLCEYRSAIRTRPTDSDDFQIPVPSLHALDDLYLERSFSSFHQHLKFSQHSISSLRPQPNSNSSTLTNFDTKQQSITLEQRCLVLLGTVRLGYCRISPQRH